MKVYRLQPETNIPEISELSFPYYFCASSYAKEYMWNNNVQLLSRSISHIRPKWGTIELSEGKNYVKMRGIKEVRNPFPHTRKYEVTKDGQEYFVEEPMDSWLVPMVRKYFWSDYEEPEMLEYNIRIIKI